MYLNLDMPDCVVSEESTSSPMDLIWEIYSKAKNNDDEAYSRVMAYATRGGFKTLGASILEVLIMLHLKRNIGHMAATKDQSDRSQEYVVNFMNFPFIREFKTSENKKRIEITRYEHKETQYNLTEAEWKALPTTEQDSYTRYANFLQIVICSLTGANGLHSEFFCVDEVDTIDGERVRGYRESKNIPKARNGLLPITLLTSTRKFSYGLVQKELDTSAKTKLQVRHWNVIDILERCPASRHKPEEPMTARWVNDETLEVLDDTGYATLDAKTKQDFVSHKAFAGCVTCPLFSICKTRLATHQTSSSPMLSPIGEIAAKIQDQSLEDVQTQLMCRKPSSAGLIYPKFSRAIHMKSATQIMEIASGSPITKRVSKQELIDWFIEHDGKFYTGIDFGFNHPFAAVTGVVWGNFCFVIDCISQSNLELDDKIAACGKLVVMNPTVFADPEDPASAKTFARKGGFHVREWDKGAGSVKAGIDIVRTKLRPAVGNPSLFLLAGDEKVELLASRIEGYHFETDVAGEVSEKPAKVDDDELDALRYMVMNAFANRGKIVAAIDENNVITGVSSRQSFIDSQTKEDPNTVLQREMQQIINGFLEGNSDGLKKVDGEDDKPKKKSKFLWDI